MSALHVIRAGFAPLKGARHTAYDAVLLDEHGPVGDREWCLVDAERRQVLRSIQVPLMAVRVDWDGHRLAATLPDGTSAGGVPRPSGERIAVDYWGREIAAELHDGEVAALLAGHLGRPVRLARVPRGGVVYGAPVSLVGTASIADVAERMGVPTLVAQPERLRATFVIETDEPYVEDAWAGREIALGEAVIRVNAPIGRCGLINRHPTTAAADLPLLKSLAGHRPVNDRGEPFLAVDAVVVRPGRVRTVRSTS